MNNKLIITCILLGLLLLTALGIWFGVSLIDEKSDVILVNGKLYYYENSTSDKRFLEQYISEGWYIIGDVEPIIDAAPKEELQLRVAEGTVVSGSVYVSDDYPDAVILSLEGSKPKEGVNMHNPNLHGVHIFLSERLRDYTYIRYNNNLYKRQRGVGTRQDIVDELSEECLKNGFCGFLTYDDETLSGKYGMPKENKHTNCSYIDNAQIYMEENNPQKLYVKEKSKYYVYRLVNE